MRLRRATCLLLAASLGACSLGPDYRRPPLDVPAAFRATPASARTAWPAPGWWHGFGSPDLDRLITSAVAYNNDLQAAIARVIQADAQVEIAGAPLLPSLEAVGSGSYEHVGTSGRNGRGGSIATVPLTSATGTVVTTTGKGHYQDLRSYSGELQISYEADFWGRNRALSQSAEASALASRFDQQTVALTVITSVAVTYFQALALMDRLGVARSNLADAEQVLRAYQGQLQAGTASALDVAQQQALVDGIRANIPNLQGQLRQQIIALGILTGLPPERIDIKPGSLASLPTPAPVPGLPAEVLARRPDVAFAEAELVAQNGNVRAARAAFFPTVTLTGAAGWQGLALSTLVGPGNALTTIAGNVVQTIFDNGLKQGQLRLQKGRYGELAADYRKAVLQAFTDVENAETALDAATRQEKLERQAVASARRATDIARAQLQAGTINVISQLNAQVTLYNDLDLLTQVRLSRFQALIDLYKALGGGWTLAGARGT